MLRYRVVRHASIALLALAALCAAGCDPVSGVHRIAELQSLPSRASVEAALHAVPEVEKVEYRQVQPSAAWSLYEGVIRDPAFDQFSYSGAGTGGVVEVRQTEKGEKTLRLYYLKIGPPLPRDFVDRTRALMDKVYESIRANAPEVPPEVDVREEVIRVRE